MIYIYEKKWEKNDVHRVALKDVQITDIIKGEITIETDK